MPDWKNYLKGVYDTKPTNMQILVTGSARLDVYDQLGDSLAGRYFRHRLMPLSLSELTQTQQPIDLERLLNRGGFPEPYFCEEPIDAERWRMQYKNSLLSTDVFEFDKIQNIKALQLIFELLRHQVGSPVSYQSLAEDVGISPTTVKTYIQILEALYIVFRVTPYSKNIARSLLKEPKIYFFDTGMVSGDEGAKFENLVAISLLKNVYARTDYHAEECQLQYLRTKEGKEVDFAIVVDQQIEKIVEAKLSDTTPTASLVYFNKQYQLPAIQIVKSLRNEYKTDHIEVIKAENFLSNLFM
jgi:predicted AAA+ superfamily ATPase